jgi:hypothetical protein
VAFELAFSTSIPFIRIWALEKYAVSPPPPHFRGDEDSLCDYPMLFLNIKMWMFAFSVPTLCICQRKDVNVK